MRVDIYEKWAELDERQEPEMKDVSADLTRLGMRIYQCTEGRQRSIYIVRHDLSEESAPVLPKLIRVLRARILPDKVNDYLTAKKDYLALWRKAGGGFYTVLQARFGAPAQEFVTIDSIDNWAALDSPSALTKAVGADALWQMGARMFATEAERQIDVYRFEPDLSYFPARPR